MTKRQILIYIIKSEGKHCPVLDTPNSIVKCSDCRARPQCKSGTPEGRTRNCIEEYIKCYGEKSLKHDLVEAMI